MPTRSDFILCSSLWLSSSVAEYGHQPSWSSVPLWGGVGRVRAAADTWRSEGGGREQRMKSPGRKRKVKREDGYEVGPIKIPSPFKWPWIFFFNLFLINICFQVSTLFHQLLFTQCFWVTVLSFLYYCFEFSIFIFHLSLNICCSPFPF